MPSCIISTSEGIRLARFIALLMLLLAGRTGIGQVVTIRSIEISGNRTTKSFIIRRELTFREGDTLPQRDLGLILERNRDNLINIGIFNQAVVNIAEWDTREHLVDISVTVRESWYVYAAPIFDLADRNFNVWWNTYNASLRRVNLGGRLDWLNLTGRNDKLKLKVQFGFTPKQEIEYRFPYLDKRQRFGLLAGFFHSSNKEAAYGTVANREQFVRIEDRRILERYRGGIQLTYRPSIRLRHDLDMIYQVVRADSQFVDEYNPRLFRLGGTSHRALTLAYTFEYDDRDIRLFAEKGVRVWLKLEKTGWGRQDDENLLTARTSLEGNVPSGRRFQHRVTLGAKYSLIRSRPSYMHYLALGYGQDYLRGYELYLIDGLDFFTAKYQLSYKLLESKIRLGTWMPMKAFREMPIHLYLSMHLETGYVNDPYTGDVNTLSNRWLTGTGPGINLLLYNNMLVQFNYCVNHLGQWGLYLHNRTSF